MAMGLLRCTMSLRAAAIVQVGLIGEEDPLDVPPALAEGAERFRPPSRGQRLPGVDPHLQAAAEELLNPLGV